MTRSKAQSVFIGVSGPNLVTEELIKAMAKDSIIFALANPDPEIDPIIVRPHIRPSISPHGQATSRTKSITSWPSQGDFVDCSTGCPKSPRRSRSRRERLLQVS